MSTQIGKGHIHGLTGGALGIASLSGYVSPNLKSLRLGHNGEVDRIRNQGGDTASLIAADSFVECEFDFIPEGSTIANAKLAAGIPDLLAGVTITGLPIIAYGPFTDVLNTNAGNTQPWIYEGGASIQGESEQKWTARMTLRRYPLVTSATAIT